ncbi:MAG: hypothetical protein AB1473_08300 [Thermodesulfobacteriota bacterium]
MKNTLLFTFCALFAFIAISVLLYHPGFSGPMMYDSERLTRNAHAFAAHDLELMTSIGYAGTLGRTPNIVRNRIAMIW